jgi:murein DD-endopeptidase MepM/ murein hydrolase activator NlpD
MRTLMKDRSHQYSLAIGAFILGIAALGGSLVFESLKTKTSREQAPHIARPAVSAITRAVPPEHIEPNGHSKPTALPENAPIIKEKQGKPLTDKLPAKAAVTKATKPDLRLIKTEPKRLNPDLMPRAAMDQSTKSGELGPGQTVGRALQNFSVGQKTVTGIVEALKGVYDFRLAQPGARFEVRFDGNGRVTRFQFEHDQMEIYVVDRDAEGKLVGRQALVAVSTEIVLLASKIQGSLYATIKAMNEDPRLASKLVSVFAWDMDFHRDTHPNDGFKMVVEKYFKEASFVQYGRVLAAEYVGKKGTFRSYFFKPKNAPNAGYFLADGQSAEKVFLATPLKFARISSGFDRNRKHPILGYTKAHLGVDYAAPRGTPVWAMASGKVTFAGWKGANGRLVRIDHGNGILSGYSHLHRIRKEIKKGVRVRQKQVIGYVGTTGRSTGPHLHFSIRKNGRYVNPRNLKVSRLKSVPKSDRVRFKKVVAAMDARMNEPHSLRNPTPP